HERERVPPRGPSRPGPARHERGRVDHLQRRTRQSRRVPIQRRGLPAQAGDLRQLRRSHGRPRQVLDAGRDAMTSPPDPAPPTPRARVPLQVLVVDDDDVDREFVRRTLTRSELDVTVLEESDPAVALATVRRSEPDVVVLDYSFPRHDGLTVLHELHEIDPRLPVIVMTGRDGSELAVRLMKAGAVDYLPKSTITPERLAQSIRHALRLRASEIAAR